MAQGWPRPRLRSEAANQQAFLLQQDSELDNPTRQAIYSQIIQPLLDQAAMQEMNPQETAQYVERSLRIYQPQDAATRRLYNILMAGRDASLRTLDNFIGANQSSGWSMPNIMGGFSPSLWMNNRLQQGAESGDVHSQINAAGNYDWFVELQGQ